MKIKNIFTNILATEILDLDNQVISDYCRKKIEEANAVNKGEFAYNQSRLTVNDLTDLEMKKLYDIVEEKFNYIHRYIGLDEFYKQVIGDFWCNLNHTRNTSEPHTHPNSIFTAVYYPEASSAPSDLILVSPIAAQSYVFKTEYIKDWTEYTSNLWEIYPEQGMLVIFPSWLMHFVRVKTKTNEQNRISIAFECNVIENNKEMI